MPAIIAPVVSFLVTVGSVVYTIGKAVYDYIIKPLAFVTSVIEKVRAVVRGVIEFIQGKINYVLDFIGADILIDLVTKVREFAELGEAIAKGNKEAILKAIGGTYEAIAGTAYDILTFVSQSLSPIFDRLAIIKSDIERIEKVRFADITRQYEELGEEIKEMPRRLLEEINATIAEESERIKEGFRGELAVVNAELTRVISLSEDLEHFARMFTELMES